MGNRLRCDKAGELPVWVSLRRIVCLCAIAWGPVSFAADPAVAPVLAGGFHERQKAASSLGRRLPPEAVGELMDFLGVYKDARLESSELLALKDCICSALENQSVYPAELPGRLTAMYRDPAHAVGWRDYCIQHLSTACRKIPADQRPAIIDVFKEAVKERQSTIAGTALIALRDNQAAVPGIRELLANHAREIAADSQSVAASRVTALQISAGLGDKRVLPAIRMLVQDSVTERPLRLAAVAALGTLGGTEDLPVLEPLASGSDRMFKRAAATAIAKIEAAKGDGK